MALQETAGCALTEEQVRWLEAMRDHITGSVSMEMGDFYTPRSTSRAAWARRMSCSEMNWAHCSRS